MNDLESTIIDKYSDLKVNITYSTAYNHKHVLFTNSCESFHSKLNSESTKSHPNLIIFTHVLNMKILT